MARRRPGIIDPSTPRPQSMSIQLQIPEASIPPGSALDQAIKIIQGLTGFARDAARTMLIAGCRAQEALKITSADIDNLGFVKIQAGKRSRSRVAFCPHLLPYRTSSAADLFKPIFPRFSYFKFRRAILRAAVGQLPRSRRRMKVTNLFRMASAQIADRLAGDDPAIASEFLGHRSTASTNHYRPIERKKHG